MIDLWISGRVPVKKNTQRVIQRGRRKFVVYSARWTEWERFALNELRGRVTATINEPIEVHFTFYFKNRQAESDVSNLVEGPQDVLTKAGIISDDKIIRKVVAEKIFGEDPGVWIRIYRYAEAEAA